jgi:hypothetical protein
MLLKPQKTPEGLGFAPVAPRARARHAAWRMRAENRADRLLSGPRRVGWPMSMPSMRALLLGANGVVGSSFPHKAPTAGSFPAERPTHVRTALGRVAMSKRGRAAALLPEVAAAMYTCRNGSSVRQKPWARRRAQQSATSLQRTGALTTIRATSLQLLRATSLQRAPFGPRRSSTSRSGRRARCWPSSGSRSHSQCTETAARDTCGAAAGAGSMALAHGCRRQQLLRALFPLRCWA